MQIRMLRIDIDDKYSVMLNTDTYALTAYRNGEVWEAKTAALVGDKFTTALVVALAKAQGHSL